MDVDEIYAKNALKDDVIVIVGINDFAQVITCNLKKSGIKNITSNINSPIPIFSADIVIVTEDSNTIYQRVSSSIKEESTLIIIHPTHKNMELHRRRLEEQKINIAFITLPINPKILEARYNNDHVYRYQINIAPDTEKKDQTIKIAEMFIAAI